MEIFGKAQSLCQFCLLDERGRTVQDSNLITSSYYANFRVFFLHLEKSVIFLICFVPMSENRKLKKKQQNQLVMSQGELIPH